MNSKLGYKSELTYFLYSYKHETRYFLVYFPSLNKKNKKMENRVFTPISLNQIILTLDNFLDSWKFHFDS